MTKAVIIGGGLLGMLSARELALAGCEVEIVERGRVGQESSWAGGGILSPLYPWRYADPITELVRWSQAHYRAFSETLLAETGIDPQWSQSGLLMPGLSDTEQAEALQWAGRFGYRLETLGPEEVAELSPSVAPVNGTALWMPEVAQLRNPRLVKALHAALRSAGVTIRENSPVTAIEEHQGQVTGVRCGGAVMAADKVVICGGAWSGEIARQLGIEVAVRPVKGQMLLFRAAPGLLQQVVLWDGYYLIPRRDGRILIGSTLEETGFDKQTTDEARELLRQQAFRILPALEQVELEHHWAGLRPGSPEGVPFIGPVPGLEGLSVNAGQYRNGVVTGLASARLLKNLVLDEAPILPPDSYQLR
ncbi:MAG: glycine oxidase ThiO [Gammaproteobacteria bacterium]|nr:glycine oxidase ThiO [Gammaproteobacteria bacterium]